ncbi:amidase [Lacisediminihabitans changchengi]|uniref:Amidase n=1 Tax=Lacisediminihabitans changchengi TaxID=2787634 RepID=A0A934SIT0_9MICO|nr:amidase [Lacisediminihabitans changchengi]MBK4347452.1 amidase [Lacisediminihabitans changchengi]
MFELHHLSAQEQWDWLQRGEITPTELTEHYLSRIERIDPEIGAFVTVTADAARSRSASLDAVPRTAALWGLPFADKDLYDRAGVPTRSGSRLLADYVAADDHDIVRTLDEAGGVSLGKTATPEFGLSSSSELLAGQVTRNPWDLGVGTGGSSAGAAAAVAAGLLPFAPGSDGGGSIRIPAAATGLVGLKPSRGRVPAQSGIASIAGLAVGGPIARTVADAAMLLDAMVSPTGLPPEHLYALRAPESFEGAFLGDAMRGEGRFQIAVMTTSPWDDVQQIEIDPGIRAALDGTVDFLVELGHGMEEIALQPSDYPALFTTVWKASAAGIPARTPGELELLEPITRWLVEQGRAMSAETLLQAQAGLFAFERSVIRQFASYDAVLTPTLAQSSRPIGWYSTDDPELNFAQQVAYAPFTSFVNVAGLPAISLPFAVDEAGMPVGVQLIGRPGGESALLSIGRQLERRARWERRHPPQW